MSMQIRQIILYGTNGKTRTITLRLDALNIVTGKSRTGKTALLDIIDYCLGRTTCNVPEGVIRSTVAWYALLLQFPETQVFVAHRSPEPNLNTNPDAIFEVGNDLTTPATAADLTPNITLAGLNESLGRLLGITPNENVPPPGQTRLRLRAKIEHAKFLIFQGQSEIATRAVWQPYYGEELTDDEVVGLLLNVGTLFRILRRRPDEEPSDREAAVGGEEAVRGARAGQQP